MAKAAEEVDNSIVGAYMRKYGRVYNQVANAKANEEIALRKARRAKLNASADTKKGE